MKATLNDPRVKVAIAAMLGALMVALAIWQGRGRSAAPAQDVTDLTSIEALQADFNGDAGTPRLILILAPT